MTRCGVTAIFLAMVALPASATADVRALDRAELEAALKQASPCCVVDARSANERRAQALVGVVPYREDMVPGGVGPMVVIGDTDAQALAIGARLAARAGKRDVLVVRGGAQVWLVLSAPEPGTTMPKSFVIPSNTCQQGQPLQSLKYRKP